MTRSSQKQQEREILRAYFSALGEPLKGSDVCEQEGPDFIVRFPSEFVGVELLGYEQFGTDQSVERTWQKLRGLAFDSRNLPEDKCFTLYFRERNVPKGLKHQQFLQEVERFWFDYPNDVEGFATERLSGKDFPLLQQYVLKISVSTVGFKVAWQWNYSVRWIGVREGELISSIEKKKRKFVTPVDRKWLLLHPCGAAETWMEDVSVEKLVAMSRLKKELGDSGLDRFIIWCGNPVQWDRARGWEPVGSVA